MISTIKKQNLISIKAHLKAGFIEENKEKQKGLIENGLQKQDEIRFVWQ